MTTAMKIKLIEKLIAHKAKLDEVMYELIAIVNMDPASKLFDAAYKMEEVAVDATAELLGDRWDGWLSWYIYENDCGKKGLAASVGKRKPKPIATVKQLVGLIEGSAK